MKIGIDISSIVFGTGVSLYTSNLVKSLAKYHPEHDYTLYGGSLRGMKKLKLFADSSPKSKNKLFSIPPKIQSFLFNQLHFPINTFTSNLDIFHSWDWYTPKVKKAALVTTIHDLSALKYSKETHPEIVRKHKQSLKWIQKEASAIIAVSNSTKKDIVNLLKIDPQKIHVIYEALPEEKKIKVTTNDRKKTLKKYKITKPFFISVASLEPRKNLKKIIKAFSDFDNDYQLVLVGRSGYDNIPDAKGLIKTGYVSETDLACLYKESQALIFASLYEGFGLPILEAFYHHTPVVTSNVSSMPEIVGDAGVLVDPLSIDSIKKGIKQAISNKDKLVKTGKQRLEKFSWKQVSDQTIKVYLKANEKK